MSSLESFTLSSSTLRTVLAISCHFDWSESSWSYAIRSMSYKVIYAGTRMLITYLGLG